MDVLKAEFDITGDALLPCEVFDMIGGHGTGG